MDLVVAVEEALFEHVHDGQRGQRVCRSLGVLPGVVGVQILQRRRFSL